MKINTRKNMRKNNLQHYPSDKTRWAYWMQAIEPTSKALNEAFPGYHPQWVQMSQMRKISPKLFAIFRENLHMSQEQCAAFLRVAHSTVAAWERGSRPVPFACFELLRVIQESVAFKMSHPEWDGWFISNNGNLVSPDVGCSFSPGELNVMSFQRNDLSWMRGEIARLKSELNAAIEANNQLRQMFLSQGVVEELVAMKNRLNALVESVTPSQEIPSQRREKIIDGTLA